MIIPDDINQYVQDYINDYIKSTTVSIEYSYRTINISPLIRNDIIQKLINKYELEDSILGESSIHYLNVSVKEYINKIVTKYFNHCSNKKNIQLKLEKLKKLELPEQRSPEWYEMRETMLTASSLADALGKGHFRTRDNLLIDKTSSTPPPYISNDIIEWGVKYEPVATTFYEKHNNLTILEFGLVPHPEFKIFGASPDGICDENSPEEYIGRMLEIKCPPIRKFTAEVPEHYWMQMQGQLETCDLEECDFLQVKLFEYDNEEDYNKDKYLEKDILKDGLTSNNLPKGLVLAFSKIIDGKKKYHYEYSEFYQSQDDLKKWAENIIKNYSFDKNEKVLYNWWKIERYECTLVHRDRVWWLNTMPEIMNFWEDVEHYRLNGNQELIQKKLDKQNKRKKKKKENDSKKEPINIITINQEISDKIKSSYLLDSDSE